MCEEHLRWLPIRALYKPLLDIISLSLLALGTYLFDQIIKLNNFVVSGKNQRQIQVKFARSLNFVANVAHV